MAIISRLDTVPTQHLSHGQIAGIIVGSIVGLGTCVVLILGLKLKDKALFGIAGSEKPELDGTDLSYQEKDDVNPQEIDGQEHRGNEVDGTRLPGHEVDGQRCHGYELEGRGQSYELPALESPAIEMAHCMNCVHVSEWAKAIKGFELVAIPVHHSSSTDLTTLAIYTSPFVRSLRWLGCNQEGAPCETTE